MTPVLEILITTFNEAAHIAEAIASCRALGRVLVVDSGSTDGTRELATAAGAEVFEHPFAGYAAQKNWALDHLPWRGEWVFILDADERITPPLAAEIRRRLEAGPGEDGFLVNRQLLIMGRAIRHGGLYPAWNLRLFRRGRARYEERLVHEHMICRGPVGTLHAPMLHIRRESISQYMAKHIRYADLEADEWLRHLYLGQESAPVEQLFSRTLLIRQWVRRHVWPRLPCRPLWRFVYMYIVRLGFLDGVAGWHLAWMMSCYEYMIGALYREKVRNLRAGRTGDDGTLPNIPV
jgi:glycosyltransferase involved in cell wall biosynthesis